MRILCVCLGNICRSPMAEGAIRRRALEADLPLAVDSAGLAARHAGKPPDPRGLAAAAARGYDNSGQRARQVSPEDFGAFDLILAMDADNLAALRDLCPPDCTPEIRLFHPAGLLITDPWYGGPADYEHALDLIEASAEALIADLASNGRC